MADPALHEEEDLFDEEEYYDECDDEEAERKKYAMFDDMALGVMRKNSQLLDRQQEQDETRIQSAKPVTFRFDVTTARNREQNPSTSRVDLSIML